MNSSINITRGAKRYKLTNHLGNVNVMITDKRVPVCNADTVTYNTADVVSANDYSPFGAPLAGRTWYSDTISQYRFGFNGVEKEDNVSGVGNSYSTEYREYDPRLGRWFSIDPLFNNFPWQSPYAAFDNNPVLIKDPKGLAGENSNDNGERKRNRINRKIDNLKKRNAKNLIGMTHLESYAFLKRKYPEKFRRWENINERSSSTGWDVKAKTEEDYETVAKKRIQFPLGIYDNVVDLGKSKATFKLTYNMLGYANKIDIINEETGDVVHTTGYVLNKDGSGATFNIDLGSATKIRIVANDGIRGDLGFKFKLVMYNVNKSPNINIIKHDINR